MFKSFIYGNRSPLKFIIWLVYEDKTAYITELFLSEKIFSVGIHPTYEIYNIP